MGFFTGRAAWLRFQVEGPAPDHLGPLLVEKLSEFAIGRRRVATADGVEVGWTTGEDILDTAFDLAKNIVDDTLHFALRIDAQKLPADLLRAYARAELRALAANNPSGRPSARQKKEAREAARERLEAEAKDGRFLRCKAYSLLWDFPSSTLLVGTTSANALDRAQKLFTETFGHGLTLVDAGHHATQWAERSRHQMGLDAARPATFVAGGGPAEVAWVKDPASYNYLGNEFFLWLWFVLETEGDTLVLPDKSEATVLLARTLLLECPRAESGTGNLRSEVPVKLPEARRAVQAGKLPRQAGLTLVRHDRQYELTLQAETWAISGAKLPDVEEREERVRLEERVGSLRHLIESVDLLYDAFLGRRLGTDWPKELGRVQRWLRPNEGDRRAAAG